MAHEHPLIAVENLTLGYGQTPVLERLSFHICRGEFLGIVGPNGSGKTTILRALLGLLRPRSGSIVRADRPLLGYVPQRERIDTIVPVTAGEVALMGRAQRLGPLARVRESDRGAARRSLERVGVGHLTDRLFRDLSGGQQQRVLLARALAAEPDLLVLDEPTNGMDLSSEHAIIELLVELNRRDGLTVLLVTHLLSIVLNAATSILLIDRGRALYGGVDEVLEPRRLSELYGLPVSVATIRGRRTLAIGGADV